VTADDFVRLAKALRELGAASVEAHGYKAVFPVAVPLNRAQVGDAAQHESAPVPTTPEEIRAARRARALGLK